MPEARQEEDSPAPDLGALAPYLLPVYTSHSTLGTDQAGRPLWTEMVAWLTEHGVDDPEERQWWLYLWQQVTDGKAEVKAERRDRDREDRERRPSRPRRS